MTKRLPLHPADRPAAAKRAVAYYRLGGREYPITSSPHCFTCQSKYRVEIEEKLLLAYSYQSIVDSLPDDHGVTAESIKEHIGRHMPLREATKRVIIEQRGNELGQNIEKHTGRVADHITLLRLGVSKALERMVDGELVPDMGDAVDLIKLQLQVEAMEQEGVDQATLMQGFLAYMSAMEETLSEFVPERRQAIMQQFSRRLSGDPIMNGLMARSEADAQEDDSIIDVEVLPMISEANDDAPAVDSTTSRVYPREVVFDEAPAGDYATAKVFRAEEQ